MTPDIEVSFAGNLRVEAEVGGFRIATDQAPEHGGEGAAPQPFQLFLASLATCAGFFVARFCRTRELPLDGIRLTQSHEFTEPGHVLRRVTLRLQLPPEFPPHYHAALERAVASCSVKKAIAAAPEIVVTSEVAAPTEVG